MQAHNSIIGYDVFARLNLWNWIYLKPNNIWRRKYLPSVHQLNNCKNKKIKQSKILHISNQNLVICQQIYLGRETYSVGLITLVLPCGDLNAISLCFMYLHCQLSLGNNYKCHNNPHSYGKDWARIYQPLIQQQTPSVSTTSSKASK